MNKLIKIEVIEKISLSRKPYNLLFYFDYVPRNFINFINCYKKLYMDLVDYNYKFDYSLLRFDYFVVQLQIVRLFINYLPYFH
jgi:hypothetical protein